VERRLRIDVVKGESEFVFIDGFRRQIAAQDAREDIILVIGQGGVDRHRDSWVRAGCG
jgi:hypothetical protein